MMEILIEKANTGEVEVGPIKTGQHWVRSLAYSPSSDRIASGGDDKTICICDSNTGELLVGPIKNLGIWVSIGGLRCLRRICTYFRVSGTELPSTTITCIPSHFLLNTISWHVWVMKVLHSYTESYQSLCKPFGSEDRVRFEYVSFCRNGRYLAYGGDDKKITLRMVKNTAPELAVCTPIYHPSG